MDAGGGGQKPAVWIRADVQTFDQCTAGTLNPQSQWAEFREHWLGEIPHRRLYDRCTRVHMHRGPHRLAEGRVVTRGGHHLSRDEESAFWAGMDGRYFINRDGVWAIYNHRAYLVQTHQRGGST